MKTEISAVKNDIENSISAVKDDISAVKNDIKDKISAFQDKIKAGHAEFEERVTCTLDTQLKIVTTRVEKQAQELRDDFNKELQVTREESRNIRDDFHKEIQSAWQDIIQTTQRDWEATARDLEARLAAVDARMRSTGNGNLGTNAGQVMPPKFDGTTTPWATFHRQFEAAADNNGWTPSEKPRIC
jgi:polyhydroxyalkanoate synthesis regulator phasin